MRRSEIHAIDALTSVWESVSIRRYGDGQWSVSLGSVGDQRPNTGIVYADERETGYVCINGGCRQVMSGYHSDRADAIADAQSIAARFEDVLSAAPDKGEEG